MKAPHVQVVDDLGDEVAEVLDELDVRLEVGGDPEPAEHLLAEAVGGGDRRRVEVGERVGEPVAAQLDLVLGALGEQLRRPRIAAGRRAGERPPETALDADQPLADALAQLARRHPRERHQQQRARAACPSAT